ncbi:hypothetical protein DER46DRAFT_654878 [Fusarium sp. MPI-SDFR-AT-0072]|nr:hypothetical protein DER46DRAFT_654878 [Fusarium sp. MPI-SDFR-AT-0072]
MAPGNTILDDPSGRPQEDVAARRHARTAAMTKEQKEVVAEKRRQFDNPDIFLRLAKAAAYHYRTEQLFNVTWFQMTEDEMEKAWARDRLEHFNDYFDDNTYIAEGQYIPGCIGATCFIVTNFLHQLILEAERER